MPDPVCKPFSDGRFEPQSGQTHDFATPRIDSQFRIEDPPFIAHSIIRTSAVQARQTLRHIPFLAPTRALHLFPRSYIALIRTHSNCTPAQQCGHSFGDFGCRFRGRWSLTRSNHRFTRPRFTRHHNRNTCTTNTAITATSSVRIQPYPSLLPVHLTKNARQLIA